MKSLTESQLIEIIMEAIIFGFDAGHANTFASLTGQPKPNVAEMAEKYIEEVISKL